MNEITPIDPAGMMTTDLPNSLLNFVAMAVKIGRAHV